MAATNTLVRTIAKNALAPLAASAAAFGVKKLSPVFDEKVLPKLRELGRPRELASGAAAKASAPLQRVKDAAPDLPSASELKDTLVEALRPNGDEEASGEPSASREEREEARRRRQERREERRHGSG